MIFCKFTDAQLRRWASYASIIVATSLIAAKLWVILAGFYLRFTGLVCDVVGGY
jgi:hypothetical protein